MVELVVDDVNCRQVITVKAHILTQVHMVVEQELTIHHILLDLILIIAMVQANTVLV